MADTAATDVVARQYEQWSDPNHVRTLFWSDRTDTNSFQILVAKNLNRDIIGLQLQ